MKRFILTLPLLLLAGGCASSSPKITLERGWIGGEYKTASRRLVPEHKRTAVYVRQTFAGTPAAAGGLQAGDLILGANGREIQNINHFHKIVDAARPGSLTRFQVLREDQTNDVTVAVGREAYQDWRTVQMGVFLSSKFDLWPDPDISLPPVLRYQLDSDRVELRALETTLARRATTPKEAPEPGTNSNEGWRFWFVIFGFEHQKRILSQESANPVTAAR